MLPEKDIGCHRTGFAKTCRECVVEHNCQLWKPLRLDANKENGQLYTEHWACIDVHAHTIGINMLGRQDTTTATIDKLNQQVRDSNDVGMASTLAGLSAQMRHAEIERQKAIQIGSNGRPVQQLELLTEAE